MAVFQVTRLPPTPSKLADSRSACRRRGSARRRWETVPAPSRSRSGADAGEDRPELGQDRRRQLVALRELLEHGRRRVAQLGDRRGRSLAQLAVLRRSSREDRPATHECPAAPPGPVPASKPRIGLVGQLDQGGDRLPVAQRARGGDRAVADFSRRIGQAGRERLLATSSRAGSFLVLDDRDQSIDRGRSHRRPPSS